MGRAVGAGGCSPRGICYHEAGSEQVAAGLARRWQLVLLQPHSGGTQCAPDQLVDKVAVATSGADVARMSPGPLGLSALSSLACGFRTSQFRNGCCCSGPHCCAGQEGGERRLASGLIRPRGFISSGGREAVLSGLPLNLIRQKWVTHSLVRHVTHQRKWGHEGCFVPGTIRALGPSS